MCILQGRLYSYIQNLKYKNVLLPFHTIRFMNDAWDIFDENDWISIYYHLLINDFHSTYSLLFIKIVQFYSQLYKTNTSLQVSKWESLQRKTYK